MLRNLRIGAGLLLAAVSLCLPPGAAAQETWPTYQADASHTGYVPVALDPSKFALRWSITPGGGQPLNPVAAGDGKVFVTTVGYFSDAGLFVHDAQTGNELWHLTYGDVFSVNPPAYHAGKVYVQTGNHGSDTYLRAYHAATGDLAFQAAHSAQWERYLAPTIYDGTVYVNGGYYGGMYAFDADDGTRHWFLDLPQYDEWTPAVDAQYAYAYVGEYAPALYVVDRASGLLAFQIDDPNFDWNGWSMNLAPVLGGRGDAFAIHDGRLIRFDLDGRRIAWELERDFSGQPSVADGVVYAVDSGALSARDQESGALLWSWGLPAERAVGPLILTQTHVLVPCETNVYAVDLGTHQDEWSYPATGQLALAEGALYIASADGTLTALDAVPPPDSDGDGVADRIDNCPGSANPDQADTDGDGEGDACNDGSDRDADEWADAFDNCADAANADQANADGDPLGDVCDPFPDDPNNEFAQCRLDRDDLEARLAEALEALAQCGEAGDADGDGVADSQDRCAGTPASAPVDGAGCSHAQFCAAIELSSFRGLVHCLLADWGGDPQGGSCRIQVSERRFVCAAR